jgi:serine/threonine protein kinase
MIEIVFVRHFRIIFFSSYLICKTYISQKKASLKVRLQVLSDACQGLAAMHGLGYMHRDIKVNADFNATCMCLFLLLLLLY